MTEPTTQPPKSLQHAIELLEEVKATLKKRQIKYGPPSGIFKEIADSWSVLFGEVTVDEVCFSMILMKIQRYLQGNKDKDNLVDIIGYTAIIFQLSCEKKEKHDKQFHWHEKE